MYYQGYPRAWSWLTKLIIIIVFINVKPSSHLSIFYYNNDNILMMSYWLILPYKRTPMVWDTLCSFTQTIMNLNSPGSVTISGVVVLQSPRPIKSQKGPWNVIFDANFCIIEGSQMVTMALLQYFALMEMINEILSMGDKPFQKAFVVANVC